MLGRKDKRTDLAKVEDRPVNVDHYWYPWDDFDRVFDDIFNDRWLMPYAPRVPAMAGSSVPRVDISDEGDHLLIAADMPGVPKEAVEVEIHDGRLSIRSQVSEETKDEGKDYIRHERRSSSWNRSFMLPEGVKEDTIEASMEDGVLRVKVPKAKVEEPKKVTVKVE